MYCVPRCMEIWDARPGRGEQTRRCMASEMADGLEQSWFWVQACIMLPIIAEMDPQS